MKVSQVKTIDYEGKNRGIITKYLHSESKKSLKNETKQNKIKEVRELVEEEGSYSKSQTNGNRKIKYNGKKECSNYQERISDYQLPGTNW